jgi:multicomponent Na+:H+ antiporter subunit B
MTLRGREPAPELRADEPRHRPVFGAVICLALLAILLIAMVDLPGGTQPLPEIARRALTQSIPAFKTTEPVNAVVYGMRAMDTFGETFLLLAAVVSAVVITRSPEPRKGFFGEAVAAEKEKPTGGQQGEDAGEAEARQAEQGEGGEDDETPTTPDTVPVGEAGPERAHAMTVVARNAIRVVLPFLTVAGIYLAVQGFSPGGGFPAGVVLLGSVLLVYTGYGHPAVRIAVNDALMEGIEVLAALVIIVVLSLGLALAGSWGQNWMPLTPLETMRSGGTVQAFSLSELVEVATGLVIAVFSLLGMGHEWGRDREAGSDEEDVEDADAEDETGGAADQEGAA